MISKGCNFKLAAFFLPFGNFEIFLYVLVSEGTRYIRFERTLN